jgi:hypothetical protein
MNYERSIAGVFAGTGALVLIYIGHSDAGIAILSTMVGFFVGEKNGQRTTRAGGS